ncbi:MAG: ligC [Planctomycetota bacterium]|nr:ligC [Planctomycetota bacterium]
MGGTRTDRLRIGVIGLGRLWEARHKPALARLRDRIQVVAVYDQVARRAELEATSLRCTSCLGLTEIISRPDVEAILLLTPQWFGLHPITLACTFQKPVYSALPPASHPDGLERVAEAIRSSGIAYMPELARRYYPATTRLRQLLETTLGPPRLILGHTRLFGFDRYGLPGPSTQLAPVPLTIDPGSYLIDWCRHLFQAEPCRVQAVETSQLSESADSGGSDFLRISLVFPGGGLAEVGIGRYHRGAWGEATRFLPPPGFQIFAERGAAWLEMPDRIQWTDADGNHEERLPLEPTVGEVLNDQFYRLVRGQECSAPGLEDALAMVRLDQELRTHLGAGRALAD